MSNDIDKAQVAFDDFYDNWDPSSPRAAAQAAFDAGRKYEVDLHVPPPPERELSREEVRYAFACGLFGD